LSIINTQLLFMSYLCLLIPPTSTFCSMLFLSSCFSFFFFNDPATTEIYTLSLHDALPIYPYPHRPARARRRTDSVPRAPAHEERDRKSTRLNSSHDQISYAVFCLKKKKKIKKKQPTTQNKRPITKPG